jgi:hypothetical protein
VDAIDHIVMNSRLHYLGMAARVIEPVMKLAATGHPFTEGFGCFADPIDATSRTLNVSGLTPVFSTGIGFAVSSTTSPPVR